MARGGGEWTGGNTGAGVLSFKRITLLVCFVNILIALFVLRFLYTCSLNIYSYNENGERLICLRFCSDYSWLMSEALVLFVCLLSSC